jgi:hypothetical protein
VPAPWCRSIPTFQTSVCARRRRFTWTEAEWEEQQHRLRHARQHADFYLDTDALDVQQVIDQVVQFLRAC